MSWIWQDKQGFASGWGTKGSPARWRGVYREAQRREQTCSVLGITSASGNYHGNKVDGGERQEARLVRKEGRAEVTKDAASHEGQEPQLYSNLMGSQ